MSKFDEDDLDTEYESFEADTFEEGEFEEFSQTDFEAHGINPKSPTRARPGSEAKVMMLSARYAAGLPLWHDEDCYEHGPRELDLMGGLDFLAAK